MRWILWVGALLLAGCGGSVVADSASDSDPGPDTAAPDCSGAWQVYATERPDGTCGSIVPAISDGLSARSLPCDPHRGSTGEPLIGCMGHTTLQCSMGSETISTTADIELAAVGYNGVETVSVTDASGAEVCRSTYDVTYRR